MVLIKAYLPTEAWEYDTTRRKLERILSVHAGGWTRYEGTGGWRGADGTGIIEEVTVIESAADMTQAEAEEVAEELAETIIRETTESEALAVAGGTPVHREQNR